MEPLQDMSNKDRSKINCKVLDLVGKHGMIWETDGT
jgi:hypothetical protein